MRNNRLYRTRALLGVVIALLFRGAALPAQTTPAGSNTPSAPTSTSSQAPVAEIDAIAYDNLRNNAQQIYGAIKGVDGSQNGFVMYDKQLFSQLPTYRPAVREVDQMRIVLCQARASTPPPKPSKPPAQESPAFVAPTLDIGTALSGIASLLGVFKPNLSVSALELPNSDQVLIADFASVARTAVYVPAVSLPNLEPDPDPLAGDSDLCRESVPGMPSEVWSRASLLQEWRAAGKVADQLATKLKGIDPATPYGKKLKDALDAYTALLKKYTTTDASGNSPLASLTTTGRLQALLDLKHPLILVLAADDVGGAGWIKNKPFTVSVYYSGGASAHYFVFNNALDSRVVASGSVTSFNTQLDSKTIGSKDLGNKLPGSRIVLPYSPN